jgi:ATP-dependent 26S proteasome regulatory subunit
MKNNFAEMMIEIETLLRSRRTIIYLVSHEENRVISALESMCSKADWDLIQWDIVSGIQSNFPEFLPLEKQRSKDQDEILDWFSNLIVPKNKFAILVLKDYQKHFGTHSVKTQLENKLIRHFKNLNHSLVKDNKSIIVLASSFELPSDLEKIMPVIDCPLPDKKEIEDKVQDLLSKASKRQEIVNKFQLQYDNEELDHITNSFRGLTLNECEQICTYCIIKHSKLLPEVISNQKKDIIRKSGLLDWISEDINMSSIGGLDGLKYWLEKRKDAFSEEALAYGLPANPKGILLVGIQGAGKSLFAKSISSFWNFPLLRLDMGKVFSGLVGSSEQNMRQVFKVAESVAPCILWCDEIDKGMSGSKSSGVSDGGTTSRVLGSWLTWMQDRKSPVFVVATANDVSNLPPELLRKGRFDEIFFVDLPNLIERKKIFEIHIQKRQRNISNFNIEELSKLSEYFTGAEIESAIESAMYDAFSDNKREIQTSDIMASLKSSVPLAKLMENDIQYLREWAKNRARNASTLPIEFLLKSDEEDL